MNPNALPAQAWQSVLDHLPAPVALVDGAGQILMASREMPALDAEPLRDWLHPDAPAQPAGGLWQVCAVADNLWLVSPATRVAERVLALLVSGLQAGRDVFQAAAMALADGLGWRWAGVSRYKGEQGQMEILGWHGEGGFDAGYVYSRFGTPCERVAACKGFFATAELQKLYPGVDMGAESYVGQVFHGRDGRALGHLFVLDRAPHKDLRAAQAAIDMATRIIDGHMALLASEELAARVADLARTDALTGLGNRLAFEQALARLAKDYAEDELRDGLILMIDLDGLKQVNDKLGHSAGDALLSSFARALPRLARASEKLFRLGGDEFAILMPGAGTSIEARLRQGMIPVIAATRAGGFPNMDASWGIAALTETGGDARRAQELADQRMYADKRAKRQSRDGGASRSA